MQDFTYRTLTFTVFMRVTSFRIVRINPSVGTRITLYRLTRVNSMTVRLRQNVLCWGVAFAMAYAGAAGAYAESLKDRVLSRGTITIGIFNSAPWGFKAEDGGVSGIHPDIIKAVLGPLGVRKVEFEILDGAALIPGLLAKRIDTVASGLAITPARCEQVIFADPDLAVGDAVLVNAGNPKQIHSYAGVAKDSSLRMGGSRGSSNTENALKAGIPKDRMQLFGDMQSSFAALQSGRVDALTMSTPTAITLLRDPNLKGIERALPFTGWVDNGREVKNYAAIVFRSEDADFRDLYNEGLRKAKADGTVKSIFEKYGFTAADMAPATVTAKTLCPDNYR